MKFRKIITLIMLLAGILISLDILTMTDKWRFFGWGMFTKSEKDILPKTIQWGQSGQSAPSKEGLFPDSSYVFTEDVFTRNVSDWENHLKEFKGKPNIHAIEIGSMQGMSAIWQLENILTDSTSTITCIDIFWDKEAEGLFDRNIKATGVAYKVIKLKGSSEKMLRGLNLEQYDYVYIDGSHIPKWVLSDAVLSWDLLKKGGLIIFDDYLLYNDKPTKFRPTKLDFIDNYLWKRWAGYTWSPKVAIDAFLEIYGIWLEVVFKKYQVVVKKK